MSLPYGITETQYLQALYGVSTQDELTRLRITNWETHLKQLEVSGNDSSD